MCRMLLAIGVLLVAGCGADASKPTEIEAPMEDPSSSRTIQLAGDRIIHLPDNRMLTPVEEGPVVIDLATSQISGLIIHEPEENVVRVFGPPDVDATTDLVPHDHKFFYSSHAMCLSLLYGNVHAIHFWMTPEAARASLAYDADPSAILDRIARQFSPPNARVVGRRNGPLQLRTGLSRNDIEITLGTPDQVTDWPDGGTSLTYFGRVPDGDYDPLHLELSFESGELRSVYLTH